MQLYYFPASTCGLKARLTLEEKGARWVPVVLDRYAGDLNTPAYRALNPEGVVPTLVDDGRVIRESSVIMHYIDEAVAGPALMPSAPAERAAVRMWMKRADEALLPAAGSLSYALVVRDKIMAKSEADRQAYFDAIPDPARRARRISVVLGGLDAPEVAPAAQVMAALAADMDSALAGSAWLGGSGWSLADAAIAPFALRLHEFGGLWMKDYPRLADWWNRVRARPSWTATAGASSDPGRTAVMAAAGKAAEARLRALVA